MLTANFLTDSWLPRSTPLSRSSALDRDTFSHGCIFRRNNLVA
jgi:hypothetical protein